KRLFVTNVLMNLVLAFIVFSLYRLYLGLSLTYVPLALYFYFIIYVLQSYMVFISNLINKPIEISIYRYYYQRAQKKINKMDKLSVVGITGSFGKTSTKFITTTILKQEYKVLTTPESYNTPMGISKVINENLTDEFDVFVAEMGARNIGDIRELAKLTKPTIGVITSIGPTHLETFKNIDNIMKTKYELIEELPPEGIAIFNYDNKYVKKLADKTFKEKLLFGMEDVEKLDLYAENIEVTEEGTMFTIRDKKGNSVQCKTKLLGKHNIYNILAGACVAMALGLNLDQIRKGIEKIEPIPHRLNIINPGTGITIIDDSFNSNPIGAKAALEVLQQFKGGKKIIVTPGMVELGERQEEANRELGLNIAKVCDYVILVGKHITKSIYEGLIETGYNEEHIFVVNTLKDATAIIQKIAKPKDIILFENDLPDNYYA
ncbi:MAG: UDP-N-acetylmuramoyl-tripeptide--D-alanyl-D-alanine ligase, partial [Tissierellales bacterium]